MRPKNVSGYFALLGFAAALQHLKQGEAPGTNSICLKLVIDVGVDLKSWLGILLSFCLRHFKILTVWRRARL